MGTLIGVGEKQRYSSMGWPAAMEPAALEETVCSPVCRFPVSPFDHAVMAWISGV
jgi:hypothetical protein